MIQKRTLAFDVGDRTCGLALSDALGWTAQPLKTLRYKNNQDRKLLFAELLKIIADNDVQTLVVGLPLNMNGSEGPQAGKVRDFVSALQNYMKLKKRDPQALDWHFWDERLSTSGAQRHLIEADVSRGKRRDVIDTMAAVFILQGFLAQQRPSEDEFEEY